MASTSTYNDPTFDGYVTQLRDRVHGKDARRLPRHLKGRVTFVFRRDGVADRLTLGFFGDSVTVTPTTQMVAGEPTAIVMCQLCDWLAYFERADATRLQTIDFYGDTALLEALPTLAQQHRSPLHTRLGQ